MKNCQISTKSYLNGKLEPFSLDKTYPILFSKYFKGKHERQSGILNVCCLKFQSANRNSFSKILHVMPFLFIRKKNNVITCVNSEFSGSDFLLKQPV